MEFRKGDRVEPTHNNSVQHGSEGVVTQVDTLITVKWSKTLVREHAAHNLKLISPKPWDAKVGDRVVFAGSNRRVFNVSKGTGGTVSYVAAPFASVKWDNSKADGGCHFGAFADNYQVEIEPEFREPKVGDRVRRGPDWPSYYNHQDKNGADTGTIVDLMGIGEFNVRVGWDNYHACSYIMRPGKQHLMYVGDESLDKDMPTKSAREDFATYMGVDLQPVLRNVKIDFSISKETEEKKMEENSTMTREERGKADDKQVKSLKAQIEAMNDELERIKARIVNRSKYKTDREEKIGNIKVAKGVEDEQAEAILFCNEQDIGI